MAEDLVKLSLLDVQSFEGSKVKKLNKFHRYSVSLLGMVP